ncbi:MAG: MTH938/NDUFAF3 family protein [Desulfobacterales bacterium]|nr:MTH938/NDUFAF3 family protein [Desulfobacterales bacterium]
MITSYRFGKMTIDSRTFSSDLIIFPDGDIRDNWYRKSGHLLVMDDLTSLLAQKPELIIAGTGANGRMAMDTTLEFDLDALGIELRAMDTAQAVSLYNRLVEQPMDKRLGACFHLTC